MMGPIPIALGPIRIMVPGAHKAVNNFESLGLESLTHCYLDLDMILNTYFLY